MTRLGSITFVVAVVAVAAAACGGDGDGDDGPGPDATPAPYCTPAPGTSLRLVEVASGLTHPILVTAPPGDPRTFIVERAGFIKIVRDGSLRPTPYLDMFDRTLSVGDEQGLLGLAFHPDFAQNGRLYISYSREPDGMRVIAELTVDPTADAITGAVERPLITDPHPRDNHNGGAIEFGPDGFLYIAFGDGGGANDSEDGGQNPDTLRGKILRIDVDGSGPNGYAIPATNPWIAGGGVPEMWAWGLRNPWRMHFDTAGNLFVGDVGQESYEELDVIPAGSAGLNFGWPVFEGPLCFTADVDGDLGCDDPSPYTVALVDLDRRDNEQCSVVAGPTYAGTCMTDMVGQVFYGDYCSGEVFTLRYQGGGAVDHVNRTQDIGAIPTLYGNLSSFGVDGYGEIYVTALRPGRVYRIALD